MKQKNYEKGITLIALVITIIILLILAGVAVNYLLNDNSVIDKSDAAATAFLIKQYDEKIKLVIYDDFMDKVSNRESPSMNSIKSALESYNTKEGEKWKFIDSTNKTDINFINISQYITSEEVIIIQTKEGYIFEIVAKPGMGDENNDDETPPDPDTLIQDPSPDPNEDEDVPNEDSNPIVDKKPDEDFVDKVEQSIPDYKGENIVPVYDRDDLEAVGSNQEHFVSQLNKSYNYTTNAVYVLMDDIDLSDSNWVPLQNTITNTFEGNRHTISNMIITGEQTTKDVGLFSVCSARINNLVMSNVQIKDITYSTSAVASKAGNYESTVGAIAGCMFGDGDTDNIMLYKCRMTSGTLSSGNYAGGLIGYMYNEENTSDTEQLAIISCINNIDINNVSNAGGILGGTNCNLFINKCVNENGSISGSSSSAGILGYAYKESSSIYMENCSNKSKITGNYNVAGICANAYIKSLNIKNSINLGVAEGNNVGGIIGYVSCMDKVELANCVNKANITGNYAAGILANAYSSKESNEYNIKECKNVGKIKRK